MKFLHHFFIAPFVAFGMILFWAAMKIPMFGVKNVMIEEWFVCMILYLLLIGATRVKKLFTKDS